MRTRPIVNCDEYVCVCVCVCVCVFASFSVHLHNSKFENHTAELQFFCVLSVAVASFFF